MMLRTRTNWEPLTDLQHFAEFMERTFGASESAGDQAALPIDVIEKEGALIIRASLPGIRPEDIDVSVDNNVLTIKGEYKAFEELKDSKVYRLENRFASATRSVKLPQNLDLDAVDAAIDNGVVTVRIPRVEPIKPEPKRIALRTEKPSVNELPESTN